MSTPVAARLHHVVTSERGSRWLFIAGAAMLALLVARLSVTVPEAAIIISAAVLAMGVTAVQPGLIP
ncbi:MAG: hypothetical protein JWP82_2909, partial [Humibacillus sp.]|nr:hypothetical protein [Humibacillus sp.]